MLNTPIPQILLALDGKVDFVTKTSPFGYKKKPKRSVERIDPDLDRNILSAFKALRSKKRR